MAGCAEELAVWIAACRVGETECFPDFLPPEQAAARAQRPLAERRRSATAWQLLRGQLARYAPDTVPQLRWDEMGKPSLTRPDGVMFNLSHSGEWAVCALCTAPVGVDIQQERPLRPAFPRRFAPREREFLKQLAPAEWNRAVLDFWCLKEAYAKCRGGGLRIPLDEAAFTLSPVTIDRTDCRAALLTAPQEGYHLAVCVRTERPLRCELRVLCRVDGET